MAQHVGGLARPLARHLRILSKDMTQSAMSKKPTTLRHKVSVSSTRKVFTFAYLYEGARFALEQAKAAAKGSFYNCMSSIILSAFCFEAYLNHIGAERIPYWNAIEKKLSPEEKLALLAHELDLKIDSSRRPFQTLNSIMRFRNSLAHGKTAHLSAKGVQLLAEDERVKYPEADWEKECTVKTAKKYLADTEDMINHIQARIGQDEYPYAVPSVYSASLGYIQELIRPTTAR